ncbi:MAG: DUF883 domain-containing protein [Bacteroidota bacterium]
MEASSPLSAVEGSSRNLVSGAHQAVDKLADVASSAAETLAEKRARLDGIRASLTAGCRTYVNENPVATVAVAVAAGFLLRHLFRFR